MEKRLDDLEKRLDKLEKLLESFLSGKTYLDSVKEIIGKVQEAEEAFPELSREYEKNCGNCRKFRTCSLTQGETGDICNRAILRDPCISCKTFKGGFKDCPYSKSCKSKISYGKIIELWQH